MAEKTRKKVSARTLANRYERIGQRTERLDRLCEIVPGAPDPLEAKSREELISRSEWAALDTRRRNRAVGFLRRSNLLGRFMLRPPATYLPSPRDEPFGKNHLKALKLPKVPFRYKDIPMSALAPKGTLPVAPLLALVPRLVSTPTEDLPVILNSRLFHFYWQHYFPRKSGATPAPPEERLARFKVPMLTRKTGGPFREARDRLLALAREVGLSGETAPTQKLRTRRPTNGSPASAVIPRAPRGCRTYPRQAAADGGPGRARCRRASWPGRAA